LAGGCLSVVRKSEENPPVETSTRTSRWSILANLSMLNQEKPESCRSRVRPHGQGAWNATIYIEPKIELDQLDVI
jgi:hypothetical protein